MSGPLQQGRNHDIGAVGEEHSLGLPKTHHLPCRAHTAFTCPVKGCWREAGDVRKADAACSWSLSVLSIKCWIAFPFPEAPLGHGRQIAGWFIGS